MKLKSILLLSSALLMVTQAFSQSFVQTAGKKYTLVEEATGNWCGYCPDGAQVIEQSIEPHYPHAVILSWHGPFHPPYNEPLAWSADPYTTGSGFITGFPDGTVNRDANTFGGISQDRGHWVGDINSDSLLAPKFDIIMKSYYVPSNDSLFVQITAKALTAGTGKWSINAYITEDSIPSTSISQHSYLNAVGTMCANGQPSWFVGQCAAACPTYTCDVCAVLPTAVYSHMNVVRAVLGVDMWGDLSFTNPAAGTTVTKTYKYKIPATSNYLYTKVVGVVENMDTTTYPPLGTGMPRYYSNRVAENAIMARVRQMKPSAGALSIAENTTALENVSLFPNPAANSINVEFNVETPSTTKITITNTLGQVVTEKVYPAGGSLFSETISLNNFANGVYFMKITSNGEKVTKQFLVGK
jgi:hypothetical protein